MLTVYLDFKAPGAYLAIEPTLDLVHRTGVAIQWKPFRTVERDVPKLGKEETVGESHRRVRAASQRALAIKYAAHQGIDLRFPKQPGVTDLALGVLAEIDGDPLPFIRGAFNAYWEVHANLNDLAVVHALLQESGVAHRGSLSAAHDALNVAQAEAQEIGIVGAPAYVIDDQIFVGREHLPWIEQIATS
ncbi:MAG: DsbA family protein [Pseudomonadota bacterium]